MFERWSERRRRWFLLTFCGVGWAFFLSSFAHLGPHFSRGGVGPDATHAASILGSLAIWTAVAGAFHLHLRHWAYAFLLGISLSTALVDFGIRDHAAAGVWSIACDAGDSQACLQLADFYAAGRSPIHGWQDAERLQHQACAASGRCGAPATDDRSSDEQCLQGYSRSACIASGQDLARQQRYAAAADRFARACEQTGVGDSLFACDEVLDSGYHDLRVQACEVVERTCRISSDRRCVAAEQRCARVSSPHAGVN